MRRRQSVLLFAVVLGLLLSVRVDAYLKLGTPVGDRIVALKWAHQPVRYFITNRDIPGVTSAQLQSAAARAFSAWTNVSTASISSEFVGFTSADPFDEDAISTIGFHARPDLDRVLGSTSFIVDSFTGEIVES